MDIIERAARALAYGSGAEDDWESWMPSVCMVLMAIREPSEAMVVDGTDARDNERSAVAIWQAMIDAALNPPAQKE